MTRVVLRATWHNIIIVTATVLLGAGEYVVLHSVDSLTYRRIFFFLLIVLYCNIIAKSIVALIHTYDEI